VSTKIETKVYDKLKVAVCQPSRVARPGYLHDVQNLVLFTVEQLVGAELLELGVLVHTSTYIDESRNDLVTAALKAGVTHVLFLDDDMRFPKDALVRLLLHTVPVVGANYVTRGIDEKLNKPRPLAVTDGGNRLVYTRDDSTGLEEVEAFGTGVMLIQATLFEQIAFPWFEAYYKHGRHHGEDYDFCRKVRESGARVFIDHDLSKEVRHVGEFEYDYRMALPDEEG
jgi:hypothetical protein